MTTKYGFSDVREQLVDSIKNAYPTKWEDFRTARVLGEDVFGSPKPHPNAVLNLFTEQNIKSALPFAAYQVALGGFSSLTNDEHGMALPRLALATIMFGAELIRSRFARFAHSAVCNMNLEVCGEDTCLANVDASLPELRMGALDQIYDAMIKEGKDDVFSPLSLEGFVCAGCASMLERAYEPWRAKIWEELPRVFGVGQSWEEVQPARD